MRHLRLTEQQLDAMRKRGKPKTVDQMKVQPGRPLGKYGNKKTIVDGIEFDSRKEAKRWQELKLLESTGRVWNLKRQVRYELKVGEQHICDYIADFVYSEMGDTALVYPSHLEDCKGYRAGAAY